MPKEQCALTTIQLQANNSIISKKEDVIGAYWKVFGLGYGLKSSEAEALEKTFNNLQISKRKTERLITKGKEKSKNKKLLKITNRQIKNIEIELKEWQGKKPILKRIENMLIDHVMHVQENQVFDSYINPETLFEVIKDTMKIPRTLYFEKLSDVDNNTLKSIERQVSRELLTLKKLSGEESKLSWYQDQIMHPLAVSRKLDPTGNSYKLIKSTLELASNAYSSRAKYERVLSNMSLSVKDLIENKKSEYAPGAEFMFLHDIGDLKVDDEDRYITSENITKFLHEIGDKELTKIRPEPIVGMNKDGKLIYTDQFLQKREQLDGTFRSDYTIWRETIFKHNKNGINASGDIQKYAHKVGDKEIPYYYLMIERKDERGRVFNVAYEVPHKQFLTEKGNTVDKLENPPIRKNIEFWKEFRERNPAEHLGGVSSVGPTGTPITVPGRMTPGWYRAKKYKNITGNKEKGGKFTGQTYMNYQFDEEMNKQDTVRYDPVTNEQYDGIPQPIWDMHNALDAMFKEVAQDIMKNNQEFESKMLALLKKALGPKYKGGPINFTSQSIDQLLYDELGIDVDILNMNFTVRGKTLESARIYTQNTFFTERKNYMPIMYSDPDMILIMLRSRQGVHNKIEHQRKNLSTWQTKTPSADVIKEKTKVKNRIKELKQVYAHEDRTVKRVLGMSKETPKMNQSTTIKAAKHRSAFSNPLEQIRTVENLDGTKETKVLFHGRRKDAGVFHDYLKQTFTSIEQNKIKLNLVEAVGNKMSEAMKEYSIDQVKAAFGRDDIKAGLFGMDYSDERFGLTDTDIARLLDLNNKLASANLLKGVSVSLTNNFQRFGYGIIEDIDMMSAARTWRIENPEEAAEAAAYAGITDEIQTIADGLIPTTLGTEGREHWTSGFWNKTIMAMLLVSSSHSTFANKVLRGKGKTSQWWKKMADFLIAKDYSKFDITLKIPLSEQQQQLYAAREEALSDIWLLTRGLATKDKETGIITPGLKDKEEAAFINAKLGRTFGEDIANSFLKFSLGGSAFVRHVLKWDTLKFTESEKQMRTEALFIAAKIMIRDGSIDPSLKGVIIYKHPKVIAHARLLVNNVMFSMSQANLPKMFRGRIGKTLWKFKPYAWNQMGAEWNIIQAWVDELKNKNLSFSERRQVALSVMRNPKGKVQKQMRKLLWIRGASTALTTVGVHIGFGAANKFFNFIKRRTIGYAGANSATRGTEFQLLKHFLNMFIASCMFAGAWEDDEEEKVYEDWRRNFVPLYMNVIYDSIWGEDAFKGVRVYSKGLYEVISLIKLLYSEDNKKSSVGMF